MSRGRLGLPKIHKARITRTPTQAELVETADLVALRPEVERIAGVAVVAEEVFETSPAVTAQPRAEKTPFAIRLHTKIVRPLAVAHHRRAALRAAQSSTAVSENIDRPRQTELAAKLTTEALQKARFLRRPRRLNRSELINAESKLGSTIFGPVPAGHRREFFHDQENVWIWHESWIDAANQQTWELTVRYEVRPTGVYKKMAAGHYVRLEGSELENFRQAAHAYLALIKERLYNKEYDLS